MDEGLLEGKATALLPFAPALGTAPTLRPSEPQTLRNLPAWPLELPWVSGSVPMLWYLRPLEAAQAL